MGAGRRLAALAGAAALVGMAVAHAPWASARPVLGHGSFVHPVGAVDSGALKVAAPTMTSNNWFGYDQGSIARGGVTFHSISAQWTVPRASAHQAGQAEYSATWIGIGGGCIDSGCTSTDSTLIQAGTEQDINTGGSSYYAWWETIPGPSVGLFPVSPGDHMYVSIAEGAPEVWAITVADLTNGQHQTLSVPYSSSYLTAEWIEETPVVLGGSSTGLAPLPNLTTVNLDHATVNGRGAGLASTQRMELVNLSGAPIATPSNPDASADGFNACTWSTSCPTPKGS
ncbi:MAG TPA: G1 family glutamic endopeptidase [Acidimicrobiales bacterium]|nr:G1 family glutamic endopeptidase [Acidimicrobiales bacterium]